MLKSKEFRIETIEEYKARKGKVEVIPPVKKKVSTDSKYKEKDLIDRTVRKKNFDNAVVAELKRWAVVRRAGA